MAQEVTVFSKDKQLKLTYEYVRCALCGADRAEVKFTLEAADSMSVWVDGVQHQIGHTENVVVCKNCGLVYVNPRLVKGTSIATYSAEQERAYFGDTYNRRRLAYKDLVRRMPLWLGRNIETLLDIGCGDGALIEVAREEGIESLGTEVRESLIRLVQSRLGKDAVVAHNETQLSLRHYDVVSLINVLEHVPAPVEMLRLASRLLKSSGILVVHVPNFGGIPARLQGSRWHHIEPLEHLYYFTFKTVKALLHRADLISVTRFNLLTVGGVQGQVRRLLGKAGLYLDNGLGVVARPAQSEDQ